LWEHAGVARVVVNLLRTLPPIAPEWLFLLYCPRMIAPSHPLTNIVASNPNCQLSVLRSTFDVLFETIRLPNAIRRDKVDVFLATIPETRLLTGIPTLLTFHDAIPEILPRSVPFRLRLVRATGMIRRNISRCSEILCFSRQTADDLARIYGVTADRLTVAHLGVDPGIERLRIDSARALIAHRFGVNNRFFLMLHVAEYGDFFATYATYVARTPNPIPMVVVCGANRASKMRAEVAARHLDNSIVWLNGVTDHELSALYSACDAFVYPSLYEGFGLPVLEALKCGALCIAYGVSSVPEVLGAAGLAVDPDDMAGLVAALQAVTLDMSIRMKYQEAIDEQAGKFGWERASQAVRLSLARISGHLHP
jgi:glycosyltransferase involved in cell wall biosynthesis